MSCQFAEIDRFHLYESGPWNGVIPLRSTRQDVMLAMEGQELVKTESAPVPSLTYHVNGCGHSWTLTIVFVTIHGTSTWARFPPELEGTVLALTFMPRSEIELTEAVFSEAYELGGSQWGNIFEHASGIEYWLYQDAASYLLHISYGPANEEIAQYLCEGKR